MIKTKETKKDTKTIKTKEIKMNKAMLIKNFFIFFILTPKLELKKKVFHDWGDLHQT